MKYGLNRLSDVLYGRCGTRGADKRALSGVTGVRAYVLVACLLILPMLRTAGVDAAEKNIFTAGFQVFSSKELIERARELDGSQVMYQGEAVGEVMFRGEAAWINVHDGEGAVGIWCEKTAGRKVKYCGSYRCSGDRCLVAGIFNRACAEHGGTLDIHARELVVLARGEKTVHTVSAKKKRLATTVFVPAALLAVYYLVRRRKLIKRVERI